MATSLSPKPSFHLCPDFSIAPPPRGHLELGTVLAGLDLDSVGAPLNLNDVIDLPDSKLWPHEEPAEKSGFSRKLKELRSIKGSMWAKIFGSDGLGAMFSFLRNRENDETLTVEKLFVRYFIPTDEDMVEILGADGVASYIIDTAQKKPIYLVTGLMWAEGARLSKMQSRNSRLGGQIAATDPNSGTTIGASEAYESGQSLISSFESGTPFILGIRVRKIWWDKHGEEHGKLHIVGATLNNPKPKRDNLLQGLSFLDDSFDEQENFIIDWSQPQHQASID